MKDKTITNIHFDFVNDQVKILGFKNLEIKYQNIKKMKIMNL